MKKLEKDITKLYHSLLNKEFTARKSGEEADPSYRLSAINLVRYITLRNIDLRNIHDHLSELGISALRSCEGYVMHDVISVLRLVKLLNGEIWQNKVEVETIGYKASKKLLSKNSKQLFKIKRKNRSTKIMVSIPLEAAFNSELIRQYLIAGMEIAKIDLGRGSQSKWKSIVKNIKTHASQLNKNCLIYMELAGPEIKTKEIKIKSSKGKQKDYIKLKKGEHLILTADESKVIDNIKGKKGVQLETPVIPISAHSIIEDTLIGDRIYFSNGKIEARVLKKRTNEIELIVVSPIHKYHKIKSNSLIHLPDTTIFLNSITKKDKDSIPFIMKHSDIIGFPIQNSVNDIKLLHKEMDKYDRKDIGVIIKIKNKESFDSLPILLLEAMKKPNLGVMIDRENLSIHTGAVRIAEIQDQIMWICEAAHIPVIWDSQVLDNMVKTGLATKAEITDAAKSARVECVNLNKGPFLIDAISTLSNILEKMESHTSKKKSVMRALKVSKKNMDLMGINSLSIQNN